MSKKSLISQNSLTEGSIARALYNLALPMATGILATMSFNIVDTFFVAGLGENALAALSFTFPVVFFAISLGVGLGAGTSSVVAIAAGKKQEHEVKALITDSMTLAIIITGVLSAIGIATIEPLFRLLGATEEVLPLIRQYMVPWYIGLAFFTAPIVIFAALRALGTSKLQGKLMLYMALANAILDPIFIYGWGFVPRMEIQGAALASLSVRIVSVIFLMYYLHYKMHVFVNPFRFLRILDSFKKVLHVGVPAMATNLIIPVSNSIILSLVALHGPTVVAGFGVALQVESIALILYYALSAVIGPFCGQNMGAGNRQRVIDAQRITAKFCILSGLVMTVFLAFAGRWIASFFSDDISVISTTYQYLLTVPLSYCAYGVVMVVNASFNGLGKPMPGVVVSTARVIVILLPLAYIGNFMMGLPGIFAAIAFSNIVVGISAYFWIHRTINTIQPKPAFS